MAGKIKLIAVRELVESGSDEAKMEYMMLKITLSGYGIEIEEI